MLKTEEKAKNHTDLPKTVPIECKGYVDPKTDKTVYASGHTELRLVHSQDATQCTRCEACQKAFNKIRSAASRGERSLKNSLKKAVLKKTEAEGVLAQYGDRLAKVQQAELREAITLGTKAEVQLAKS